MNDAAIHETVKETTFEFVAPGFYRSVRFELWRNPENDSEPWCLIDTWTGRTASLMLFDEAHRAAWHMAANCRVRLVDAQKRVPQ